MGKSALGIVFSLLFIIFILPDAIAAGASNTDVRKKSGAKKTVIAGKRRSTTKKLIAQKRGIRTYVRSSNNRKVIIGGVKQKPGFQNAAYTVIQPAAPSPRSAEDTAKLALTQDPPGLKSHVALVMDQSTSEVLFEKNAQLALPIASITKLMTSLVVVESKQNMNELLTVTEEDIDREKNSYSRLRVGSQLTRANMLHIALMSSENRAASALGRHYPGGLPSFVAAMNAKAAGLGMTHTRFVEPTGLSSNNISSGRDLAKLVVAASQHPIIREYSTDSQYAVDPGWATLQYRNSNHLVANPEWEISLQKTGYISEAGRCLVMQAIIEGRSIVMVFLDSKGRLSRLGDASRIRKWLESVKPSVISRSAQAVQG
ncbi:MAG: hypothetical protein A3I66_17365 [Burkholderiales bacterium RIFCSPLOWO2_02_FULL_57_36]|nr:MAG: hypothetical protein A3I66_17365 [Burkholderiales bacterium RIFCSPLOWO2_02_FULL_57_36]